MVKGAADLAQDLEDARLQDDALAREELHAGERVLDVRVLLAPDRLSLFRSYPTQDRVGLRLCRGARSERRVLAAP